VQPSRRSSNRDTPSLSAWDLARFSELVWNETGIVLNEEKSALVLSRLHKRLVVTRIDSFDAYYSYVTSRSGGAEQRNMLHALTTNVTSFYREAHHFRHLRERVLPAAIAGIRAGRRFRIWSAACSTGEEAYSAAIEILRALPDAANYDVKILATDFNHEVVATAARGVYREHALNPLPAGVLSTYFTPVSQGRATEYQVTDQLRRLVSFNGLNLIKEWPMRGKFDVIFCRNVMIYFNRDTQEMLLERFAAMCRTGATLYIGHSERVTGLAASWFASDGLTTYRMARKSAIGTSGA